MKCLRVITADKPHYQQQTFDIIEIKKKDIKENKKYWKDIHNSKAEYFILKEVN